MANIESTIEKFIDAAKSKGWEISNGEPQKIEFPKVIRQRYQRVPEEYLAFLSRIQKCCNREGSAWFWCVDDYARTDEGTRRWNDIEAISLDSADGDEDLIEEITRFWSSMLPIAFGTDLSFLGLSLSDEDFGSVHYGMKHYWEEPERVADSFQGYLARMTDFLTGAESVEYRNESGDDCVILEFNDFM